jgi:hypothetical protein
MDHKRLHGLVKRNPTIVCSTACGDALLGATFACGTFDDGFISLRRSLGSCDSHQLNHLVGCKLAIILLNAEL